MRLFPLVLTFVYLNTDADGPWEYVNVVLTPEMARPRLISGGSPATAAVP